VEVYILQRKIQKLYSIASKEIVRAVNADTTKYMAMSQDQNAG